MWMQFCNRCKSEHDFLSLLEIAYFSSVSKPDTQFEVKFI